MSQNILIAFDDSENAMRAVEFVGAKFNPKNKVTLFHVLPDTAALCELHSPELTEFFVAQQSSFCVLEAKKRQLIEAAMEKAKSLLISSGFLSANITSTIQTRKSGIARDILAASEDGFDTIVLGRRGLSGVREFFLGSVSQKVFNSAKNLSVVIVN
ncbi:MAG: universal stress protein [Desulfobacterales bacterium]|jgi:nucleotide-binding universal stress UspA family protein|nr:universal stress protein [Desulfobacterales bacterium]